MESSREQEKRPHSYSPSIESKSERNRIFTERFSIPALSANSIDNPFTEDELAEQQMNAVSKMWRNILTAFNEPHQKLVFLRYTLQDGGVEMLTPSIHDGVDYQLTSFYPNAEGVLEPWSHTDINMSEIAHGSYNDPLARFPFSTKDYEVDVVAVYEENEYSYERSEPLHFANSENALESWEQLLRSKSFEEITYPARHSDGLLHIILSGDDDDIINVNMSFPNGHETRTETFRISDLGTGVNNRDFLLVVPKDGVLQPSMVRKKRPQRSLEMKKMDAITGSEYGFVSREFRVPTIAVLQLPEGDDSHYRRGLDYTDLKTQDEGKLDPTKHDIVHIRPLTGSERDLISGEEDNPVGLLDNLFHDSNTAALHPSNYYGTSISTGNVIIIGTQYGTRAYYVNSYGYDRAEEFEIDQHLYRMHEGLDVKTEKEFLQQQLDSGEPLEPAAQDRLDSLNTRENAIQMAAKRDIILNQQHKLRAICDYEKSQNDNEHSDTRLTEEFEGEWRVYLSASALRVNAYDVQQQVDQAYNDVMRARQSEFRMDEEDTPDIVDGYPREYDTPELRRDFDLNQAINREPIKRFAYLDALAGNGPTNGTVKTNSGATYVEVWNDPGVDGLRGRTSSGAVDTFTIGDISSIQYAGVDVWTKAEMEAISHLHNVMGDGFEAVEFQKAERDYTLPLFSTRVDGWRVSSIESWEPDRYVEVLRDSEYAYQEHTVRILDDSTGKTLYTVNAKDFCNGQQFPAIMQSGALNVEQYGSIYLAVRNAVQRDSSREQANNMLNLLIDMNSNPEHRPLHFEFELLNKDGKFQEAVALADGNFQTTLRTEEGNETVEFDINDVRYIALQSWSIYEREEDAPDLPHREEILLSERASLYTQATLGNLDEKPEFHRTIEEAIARYKVLPDVGGKVLGYMKENGRGGILLQYFDGHRSQRENTTLDLKAPENAEIAHALDVIEEELSFMDSERATLREYRAQVNYIFEWEEANHIEPDNRMTSMQAQFNTPVARPYYYRGPGRTERVGISEKTISDRYTELVNEGTRTRGSAEHHNEQSEEEKEDSNSSNSIDEPANTIDSDIGGASATSEGTEQNIAHEETWQTSPVTPATSQAPESTPEATGAQQEAAQTLVSEDEPLSRSDKAMEELKRGIKDMMNSDYFRNFCETSGKLYLNNYSFRNTLLVWLQKKDASYTAGYEEWKKFGRQVTGKGSGITILAPSFIKETGGKGSLLGHIKSVMRAQFKKDPSIPYATYRFGSGGLSCNQYKNGLWDLQMNGRPIKGNLTDAQLRKFLDTNIIGKVPQYFRAINVFDVSNTYQPEFLWVKSGFDKSELALDSRGQPQRNRRGEYKIVNTEERKARFVDDFDMTAAHEDNKKMETLFSVLQAVALAKGTPIRFEHLTDGSLGYYSRTTNDIALHDELDPATRVSVALHEMGHADMHKDLAELQKRMGDEKVDSSLREVQAEATAYIVARNFGIETDTKSFAYIADWSKGRELRELEKSMTLIWNEAKTLLHQIESELSTRGLDMKLEPLRDTHVSPKAKETAISDAQAFTQIVEQGNTVMENQLAETLVKKDQPEEVTAIAKEQLALTNAVKVKTGMLKAATRDYERASTPEAQEKAALRIQKLKERIAGLEADIQARSDEIVITMHEQKQSVRATMREGYAADPYATLKKMQAVMPVMKTLKDKEIQIIAENKHIAQTYGHHIGVDDAKFIDGAVKELRALQKAMSNESSGCTVVQVNSTDTWGKKPLIQNGVVAHPQQANELVAKVEAQMRNIIAKANAQGVDYPPAKCDLTIYTSDHAGKLNVTQTRIRLGNGKQDDLVSHLSRISSRHSEFKPFLNGVVAAQNEAAQIQESATSATTPQRETQPIESWKNDIERVRTVVCADDDARVEAEHVM